MSEDWPFGNLSPNHYGAIYADPPWRFKTWNDETAVKARDSAKHTGTYVSSSVHYQTMTIKEIEDLPVSILAAEDCVLFMWITWPLLQDALRIINAWGFSYKTCAFSWIKADNTQPSLFLDDLGVQVGLGYWTRANSEVCLLATRGSPKRLNADVRQAIIEPRREHSRKPDCVPDRIERLVAGPYCELFARIQRNGWDCWGNEISKFRTVVGERQGGLSDSLAAK